MSREKTWKQAKQRLRTFARSDNPEQLSTVQNPDDAEPGTVTDQDGVETLVVIDSPDDYYLHQPETLGIEPRKGKTQGRRRTKHR